MSPNVPNSLILLRLTLTLVEVWLKPDLQILWYVTFPNNKDLSTCPSPPSSFNNFIYCIICVCIAPEPCYRLLPKKPLSSPSTESRLLFCTFLCLHSLCLPALGASSRCCSAPGSLLVYLCLFTLRLPSFFLSLIPSGSLCVSSLRRLICYLISNSFCLLGLLWFSYLCDAKMTISGCYTWVWQQIVFLVEAVDLFLYDFVSLHLGVIASSDIKWFSSLIYVTFLTWNPYAPCQKVQRDRRGWVLCNALFLWLVVFIHLPPLYPVSVCTAPGNSNPSLILSIK